MSAPARAPEAAPRAPWWEWNRGGVRRPYTLGLEEEAMLLNPAGWTLAQTSDSVLLSLSPRLAAHATGETHGSALELGSGIHVTVADAVAEMRGLRRRLVEEIAPMGLRAASAGTHPFAVWHDTVISSGDRYQQVYGSMRELARREPTFALHVHVGVPDPEDAIRLTGRMRAHVPLLLALSVNSPFWQGRDTGLASARTPLFQAFPRVGIPRRFRDYADYVATVDLLIRCAGFDDPTFLWWDVRPQARFGTVEVRIMDAQTRVEETAALAAFVQCLARLEIEEEWAPEAVLDLPEILDENRFLAARDGMRAELIDPLRQCRVPARELAERLVEACEPHARELGCAEELAHVAALAERTGADRQLEVARGADRLPGLVESLAADYA